MHDQSNKRTLTIVIGLLVIGLLATAVFVVSGQEATPESMIGIPACDYATLGAGMASEGGSLAAQADPKARLLFIQASLATFRAECDGYTFTQAEYGANVVTDPIIFRDGSYRMHLTGDTTVSVQIEALEGDCGFVFMYTPTQGGDEQDLLQIENCVGVMTVDGVEDSNWAVVLEPLTQP